ncbi:DUF3253 domain-containing protein [Luteithermobacter gelatinilyticus]|uniref:DUF3253 domain-containing protein n=1 Tax=Luteithermobacter gelatinilyticus TaxID=2582913 RepID=UPI00143CFB19|nr:DUF3253 domain-containing protein [Luteithermobacter gelatinilyticus]
MENEEKKEDPIIGYILDAIADGSQVTARDIALKIAHDRAKPEAPKDIWRKYMLAVKQQAKHLARQGRISILRRGVPIDPNKMKGLVKFSLPMEDATENRNETSTDDHV